MTCVASHWSLSVSSPLVELTTSANWIWGADDFDPERIIKLNPQVPAQALQILCPWCTFRDLDSLGKDAYAKAFRTMQRQMHPDKHRKESPDVIEQYKVASQIVNTAKETLDDWVRCA